MSTRKNIIIIIVAALLALGVILYLTPFTTDFDKAMDAVKLDKDGNILDTVSLRVQGEVKDYLFQKTRFSYEVSDFDSFISFSPVTDCPVSTADFYVCNTGAFKPGESLLSLCTVYCSPELDRWILWIFSENIFYVASTDPNQSTSDILRYFSEVTKDYIQPVPSLAIHPS